MRIDAKEFLVPGLGAGSLLDTFRTCSEEIVGADGVPVRFAVERSDYKGYHCEVDALTDCEKPPSSSVFELRRRPFPRCGDFTAVLIVPTGIGAQLGGHAGDANALARYFSGFCDTLITHPNVVNASDVNELPENGLYVEGSVISRLLMGTVGLRRVRSNRILLVMDRHKEDIMLAPTINAASTARTTVGAEIVDVVALQEPPRMSACKTANGRAVGQVERLENLFAVLDDYTGRYDAIALASVIELPEEEHKIYLAARGELVNPWGGAEAMLTHAVSCCYDLPSAHAPMMPSEAVLSEISEVVDPRMAAEELSSAFIHCVLKGLHRAPQIVADPNVFGYDGVISAMDVDCVVIPDQCLGLPTLAAMEQGIPVIAVRENQSNMCNDLTALPFEPGKLIVVDNYLEAAGVVCALRSGVSLESIRRPLNDTPFRIV